MIPAIWDVRVLADEEPQISPTLAIFFEGCNLGCRFCLAHEHSRRRRGRKQSADQDLVRRLHGLFAEADRMQVKTVSLLGGEPSLYLAEIRQAWLATRRDGVPVPPIVLNSNMLLEPRDIVDISEFTSFYVADLKFGNDSCARTLTSAPAQSYFETVTSAIQTAASLSPHNIIIRHLPIPGHIECCTVPVLEWIARNARDAQVHLMMGYYPNGRSGIPEIERVLTRAEAATVQDIARKMSIDPIPTALSQGPVSAHLRPAVGKSESASIIIREDGGVLIPDLPEGLRFMVEELHPRRSS